MTTQGMLRGAEDGDVCILLPKTGMDTALKSEVSIQGGTLRISQAGAVRFEAELSEEGTSALRAAPSVEAMELDEMGFEFHEMLELQ